MFRSFIFRIVLLLVGTAVLFPVSASTNKAKRICESSLSEAIPDRSQNAIGASGFVAKAHELTGDRRETLILDQLTAGNMPGFIRRLQPVTIKGKLDNGTKATITLCVTPDYLALGSDRDFVRVPMRMETAMAIANRFGFALPTTKIVDAIHAKADKRLAPGPMEPGPEMISTDYFNRHNRMVEQQRREKGVVLGSLMAGHKKDLVLTKDLRSKPNRVAIYGWHRLNGKPIQRLSTVHGAEYADYSHGVRLVSTTAYVNGKKRSLYDILENRRLASLISNEGRIHNAAQLAGVKPTTSVRLVDSGRLQRRGSENPDG